MRVIAGIKKRLVLFVSPLSLLSPYLFSYLLYTLLEPDGDAGLAKRFDDIGCARFLKVKIDASFSVRDIKMHILHARSVADHLLYMLRSGYLQAGQPDPECANRRLHCFALLLTCTGVLLEPRIQKNSHRNGT